MHADLGEFELPGSWPEAEFNPDGKGRGPDDAVEGRELWESFEIAVSGAAHDAGFALENAGESDASETGVWVSFYNLSL